MSNAELLADGYVPYGIQYDGCPPEWVPPMFSLLMFMREGWQTPLISHTCDLYPQMNVIGLMWKRTGIAKESRQ